DGVHRLANGIGGVHSRRSHHLRAVPRKSSRAIANGVATLSLLIPSRTKGARIDRPGPAGDPVRLLYEGGGIAGLKACTTSGVVQAFWVSGVVQTFRSARFFAIRGGF